MISLKSIFALQKKLPQMREVELKYIGVLHHVRPFEDYERIIAGEMISDLERKAYNELYEKDNIHLASVNNGFSGSMGFIDFSEIRYSSGLESIYLAYLGVEPMHRRRGVGTKLVEEVEKIAIERGARITWGYIGGWRFKNIFPFFEKIGYQVKNVMNCGDILISKHLQG